MGTEFIESLNHAPKEEEVVSIVPEVVIEEKVPEAIPEPTQEPTNTAYTSFIRDGVEVVDVKAILKEKKVDKFGIPILPGEHRNFDRI